MGIRMRLRVISMVVITLILPLQGFAQWVQTNGPYGGHVLVLANIDSALFVATYGGVYRSSDDGRSWSSRIDGLADLAITSLTVDSTFMYAATADGIYRSTNDGGGWVRTEGTSSLQSFTVLTTQRAMVFAGSPNGGVYSSTDYGEHWDTSGLSTQGIALLVADSMSTLIAGNAVRLFHSIDHGKTWSSADSGKQSAEVTSLAYLQSTFLAGTTNGILISTDHGTSWSPASIDSVEPTVLAFCESGGKLFAGGDKLMESSDSGRTWATVASKPDGGWKIQLLASHDGKLFAATNGIFVSTNQGASWVESDSSLSLQQISRLVQCDGDLYALSEDLYRSTDQGMRWEESIGGMETMLPQDLLIKGDSIVVATYFGGLFLSTDRGASWVGRNTGLPSVRTKALILYRDMLVVGTADTGVYRSSDFGEHWSVMNNGLDGRRQRSIGDFTICVGHLYNRGGDFSPRGPMPNFGDLMQFVDSTESWVRMDGGYAPPPALSVDLLESDEATLYIQANWFGLLHSTDLGVSWTKDTSSVLPSGAISSMLAFDHFFAVGGLQRCGNGCYAQPSVLSITSDGGNHWKSLSDGFPPIIPQSIAVDSTYLYVGTWGMGIWRRPLADILTDVLASQPGELPQEVLLFQNYPNPFNPVTRIQYVLMKEERVSLRLYNVFGQEVGSLVDETQSAGLHDVVFDGGNLSSGMYFYRLEAGNRATVKKLLLIK